MEYYTF